MPRLFANCADRVLDSTFYTTRQLRPPSSSQSSLPNQESADIKFVRSTEAQKSRTDGSEILSPDHQRDLGNLKSSSRNRAGQREYSGSPATLQQQCIDAELASHVHHLSPNPDTLLKPVDPSWRLPSSPNPSPTQAEFTRFTPNFQSPSYSANIDSRESGATSPSMLMRTPPPTAKRKDKKASSQGKPISVSSGKFRDIEAMPSSEQQTPRNTIFPTSLQDQSPQLFSTMPFSPNTLDVFGNESSMPMTAPAYSGKTFWDPNYAHGSSVMPQGSPLGLLNNHNHQSSSFAWVTSPQAKFKEAIDHPDLHSQLGSSGEDQSFMTSSAGVQEASPFIFNIPHSARAHRDPGDSALSTDGVDPSLLFGPLSIHTDALPMGDFSAGPDSGYPSISQASITSTKLKRLSGGSRGGFQGNLQRSRPSVKRRATDTWIETRSSHNSFSKNEQNPQSRKTQQVSSIAQTSTFHSPTETHVSSKSNLDADLLPVGLSVDANGRAYMEPRPIAHNPVQPRQRHHRVTDLDEESSTSSSDTSSDDEDFYATSRQASFSASFSTPRHSRPFSVPSRRSGSLKRSRPSSNRRAETDSPAVSALGLGQNGSSSNDRVQRQKGANSSVSFSDLSFDSTPDGGSDDVGTLSNDPGDAQHALREVIERRSSKRGKQSVYKSLLELLKAKLSINRLFKFRRSSFSEISTVKGTVSSFILIIHFQS